MLIFLVMVSSVLAFPQLDYRSVSKEKQLDYDKVIRSIPKADYDGVVKVIIYGKEMWFEDGWFTDRRVIMVDNSGLYNFDKTLRHELTHNKCFQKKYGWDLSHDSKCFTNGLA